MVSGMLSAPRFCLSTYRDCRVFKHFTASCNTIRCCDCSFGWCFLNLHVTKYQSTRHIKQSQFDQTSVWKAVNPTEKSTPSTSFVHVEPCIPCIQNRLASSFSTAEVKRRLQLSFVCHFCAHTRRWPLLNQLEVRGELMVRNNMHPTWTEFLPMFLVQVSLISSNYPRERTKQGRINRCAVYQNTTQLSRHPYSYVRGWNHFWVFSWSVTTSVLFWDRLFLLRSDRTVALNLGPRQPFWHLH